MSNLIGQFKRLSNDKDRWQWVIDNKDNGIELDLTEDGTYVVDKNTLSRFEGSIGYTPSIGYLLDVIGIDWY